MKEEKKMQSRMQEETVSEQEAAAETAAETVPEAASPAEDLAVPAVDCAKLQEALEQAKDDAEGYKKKWYSVSAEYENYRKRTAATRSQAYTEGRAAVVVKLFPIADSLERALAGCTEEGTKKGLEMVLKNFSKVLEEEKISVIDPVGEPFDAAKCEAILAVDAGEGEQSGVVKEVYAKGYEQDGKVLRFAQVLVTR